MKNLLLFFLFTFFILHSAFSQNPLVKQWDYRFGGTNDDFLSSFQQTADGGYILGGYSYSDSSGDKTQSSWGTGDYWIVKTDSLGNKQWDKDFGGTDHDYFFSLQQTTDGGYILGGYSFSDSSGDKSQPSWGGTDYWIVKIDSVGSKQWDRRYGGAGYDFLYSLQQTSDGGYILGGQSASGISGDKTEASWGGPDYWIVKIDSLGNKQWDKDFGGTDGDGLSSIQQTSDGGYILGGGSSSGISGDKTQGTWGISDYWIIKTDSLGNKQWDKDFGGTDIDGFVSLQQTTDGGYVLGGKSYSDSSGDKTQPTWGGLDDIDYWIVKTDSLGNKQWDKDFGGMDREDEFGNISQTSDGGYLIAGTSYSNLSGTKTENNLGAEQTWIIKTDSLGSNQWDKTIFTTGHDEAGYAIQTNDGCYVFTNYTSAGIGGYKTQNNWDTIGAITQDYWIIKFCDSTLTTSLTPHPSPKERGGVFPNPADESFQISELAVVDKIEIVTLLGEMILTGIPSPSGKVRVGLLPNGIYIIKAYTGKGVFQRKLVINH